VVEGLEMLTGAAAPGYCFMGKPMQALTFSWSLTSRLATNALPSSLIPAHSGLERSSGSRMMECLCAGVYNDQATCNVGWQGRMSRHAHHNKL
jgi:hypothetical protein